MGILAMIGGLILLILVHEFGHWIVARMLGFQTPVFSIGFGKPYWVIGRRWGTEFRLSPWLLGGYVALPEMADESTALEFMKNEGVEAPKYDFKPIWKRTAVAVAGVTMNLVTALVITLALLVSLGKPYYQVTDVFVAELSAEVTIARDSGLKPDDVLVAVDGQPVKSTSDAVRLISSHKGTPAQVTVRRGTEVQTVTATPNKDGRIGITIGAHQDRKFEEIGAGSAVVETIRYNVDLAKNMVYGLGVMLHIVPEPAGLPEGAMDVHGIVAIVQLGGEAYKAGVFDFLDFLVRLSMMLAVMNILPLPLLDGGYLIFFTIEKIRGKPLDSKLQSAILGLFFWLFIGLMFLALYNDIFKPINLGK